MKIINNYGKKLAIKGHSTRGKEVIELLKMLGGENKFDRDGQAIMYSYYVSGNTILNDRLSIIEDDDFVIFNLEEFLEKYPFKVGDKVVYTKFGDNCDDYPVTIESMKWTGTTIEYTFNDCVTCLAKDLKMWNEEHDMEEDDSKFGTASNPIKIKSNANTVYLTRKKDDEFTTKIDNELPFENKNVWELPDGYQFIDENGNVINAIKIALEKKKPEYPKSYEECCGVLEVNPDNYLDIRNLYYNDGDEDTTNYEQDLLEIFDSLWELRICRDAYWKIAGEEMGLSEPWEPADNKVFGIIRQHDKIQKYNDFVGGSTIFEFPTAEMRDTFYENFKESIDKCKELL